MGERIWEDEGELQANVIVFDTKDNITNVFDIAGKSYKQFPKNTKG